MNGVLALRAEQRATKGQGPRESGSCQKWARLTVQSLYGGKYDRLLWKASARLAAEAFIAAKKAGKLPTGVQVIRSSRVDRTQLGDLLYRTDGEHGHVSIRVAGNRVAENSSVHNGRFGAIGFRPLSQVTFDTIVRLPQP